MSADLILLPMRSEYEKRAAFASDVLELDLRIRSAGADTSDSLADRVDELPSRVVPPGLWSRLGPIRRGECQPSNKDEYGHPLRWVAAGDLAKLSTHPTANATPRNRAAFAYVAALPAHWPVVLYWH